MKYNSTSFKKIYLLFSLIVLILFLLLTKANSEKKIGTIVTIKNDVYAIDKEGKKRLLDLYDEILLNEEILTNELSSATAQYGDNSTIIIKESSSFKVYEFDISGLKDIFIGIVDKGSVVIESGKIAKKDSGSMVIELPKIRLEIKGTRFNIDNKPDGTSEVSLAEDSFGNVGTINISSEGKLKTLFDPKQVISVNPEAGISERPITDDEKKELIDVSNALIEASSINDNVIQKKLEEKLLNGSLLDANGDGVIDSSDIEVLKENIKNEKQEKIDFIVDNSTDENTEFLSQVLNKSDEASIGSSLDKIFEINNDLVSSLITNLSNEDNTFLTTSNSEANNAIKEKIYTQMLNDSDNIETIGKIISKSDGDTVEKMINIVSLSDTNDANSNLSLQVLSSVADANALSSTSLDTSAQSQVNQLIEGAVANAGSNAGDSAMLANVITKGDKDSIGLMIDSIKTASENNPNSNLSLQVLSSVADAKDAAIAAKGNDPIGSNTSYFDRSGQSQVNQLIEGAVANAGSNAGDSAMLANVITKSDPDTINMLVVNIQTVDSQKSNIGMIGDGSSSLSLQVLSSVADNNFENNKSFETSAQTQVNKLIVSAVANAGSNAGDSGMLANVIMKSDAVMMDAMFSGIAANSGNSSNPDLGLNVLSSMATTASANPESFNTLQKDNVNKFITTTYSSDAPETDEDSNPAETDEDSAPETDEDSAPETDEDIAPAETKDEPAPETKDEPAPETKDELVTYDSNGFSTTSPFYHRDTLMARDVNGFNKDGDNINGTRYKNGFDINGNAEVVVTYDSNGFSTTSPFYHRDTLMARDDNGFNKDGDNINGTRYDNTGYHSNGTIYDEMGYDKDGFNQQGYNSQSVYNPFYNRSASPT
jgi:hypothetical protein